MKTIGRIKLNGCALGMLLAAGSLFGGTSARTVVWPNPDDSIQWKTLMSNPAALSLDWPDAAVSATLTIGSGVGEAVSHEITDTTLSSYALAVSRPETQKDERVLTLTLVYKDANGGELRRESARVGLVGGVNDAATRCVPDATSRKWKKAEGATAVLPIPADAVSLTVDGKAVDPVDPNGWYFLAGESGATATLTLGTTDGSSSAEVRFGGAGCLIIFR